MQISRRAVWTCLSGACSVGCEQTWHLTVERETSLADAIYRMTFGDEELFPEGTWINKPGSGVLRGPLRHPLGMFEHSHLGTGFDPNWETPIFLMDVTNGALLRDVELPDGGSGEWLLSQLAKELLEALDPEAFAFLPVVTRIRDRAGERQGPTYFMCDVVRFVDALVESRSRVRVTIHPPNRGVELLNDANIFHRDAIGPSKIFRLMFTTYIVACTEQVRSVWQGAGLTNSIVFERFGEIDD